jgi:hypothetical protein
VVVVPSIFSTSYNSCSFTVKYIKINVLYRSSQFCPRPSSRIGPVVLTLVLFLDPVLASISSKYSHPNSRSLS